MSESEFDFDDLPISKAFATSMRRFGELAQFRFDGTKSDADRIEALVESFSDLCMWTATAIGQLEMRINAEDD